MKTVIQLADFGPSYPGNFIASLLALNSLLQESGIRQVLVLPERAKGRSWSRSLEGRGVPMYFLSSNASPFSLAREIAAIAAVECPSILHTHFTAFDAPAWMASMMLGKDKPKIVWHVHSNFPIEDSIKRRIKDLIKLRIMGRSVEAITVSAELMQSLCKRGFTNTIHVIPNGVDVLRATSTSQGRSEFRRKLGISESEKVLLCFGWDPITKGVDLVVEALMELNYGGGATLLVVGRDRLKGFMYDRFGSSLPVWLKIVEPRECIADLYNAADIFISSSRWEGFPYSVGEAMASGLPIISSDIPAMEWARATEGTIYFESGDTKGLGQAIMHVIDWPSEKWQAASKSNSSFIRENYDANRWSANIFKVYEKLLCGMQKEN